MSFDDLIDFIEHRMSMSHVYQPLLIETLVNAGGVATVRQIAHAFLGYDESQLRYYEQRIKVMPVPVLARHGIVKREGDLVRLMTHPLTFEQQAQVKMLCQQRLHSFLRQRGLAVWGSRLLDSDPVPDSVRYTVLKASGGRCALCGATKHDQPLDVDHIIPRSRGGTNTLANLQVLCTRCNRAKGNRDDTDFRLSAHPEAIEGCAFCAPSAERTLMADTRSAYAVESLTPVTPQHTLIVPKRHTEDYLDLTERERRDADDLLRYSRNHIKHRDPSVVGFTLLVNSDEAGGQVTRHAAIHLIPRRPSDHVEMGSLVPEAAHLGRVEWL